MGKQTIDTEKVTSTVQTLQTANRNINNSFSSMQRAASRIEQDWSSQAGSLAHTALYNLFQNSSARSAVLQNYINLLEQAVVPGYTNAEDVNRRLADQFK